MNKGMTQKEFCAKYDLDRVYVSRIVRESGLKQGIFKTERGVEYKEEDLIKATRLYFHGLAARAIKRASEYEDILQKLPPTEPQKQPRFAGGAAEKSEEREEISCSSCDDLRVDRQCLESFCNALEGHEIILERGEKCPPWCPRKRKLPSVKFRTTRDGL